MTITLDGFGSGVGQSAEKPFGDLDPGRLHVAPFVAGGGERMFDGVGAIELKPVASRTTPHVTHLVYRR